MYPPNEFLLSSPPFRLGLALFQGHIILLRDFKTVFKYMLWVVRCFQFFMFLHPLEKELPMEISAFENLLPLRISSNLW